MTVPKIAIKAIRIHPGTIKPSATPLRSIFSVKTSKGKVQGGRTTSQNIEANPMPKISRAIGSRFFPIFSLIKKYAASAKALMTAPLIPMRSKVKPFHALATKTKPRIEKAIAIHISRATKDLRTNLIHKAIQIEAVNSIINTSAIGTPRWMPSRYPKLTMAKPTTP